MTNYLRDFTRIVLFSNDALQTDIQRIELLQKVRHTKDCRSIVDFSPQTP